MNWLDKYIMKNEEGYFVNYAGGLFVSVGEEHFRHVKGNDELASLKEISKDSFLDKLIN